MNSTISFDITSKPEISGGCTWWTQSLLCYYAAKIWRIPHRAEKVTSEFSLSRAVFFAEEEIEWDRNRVVTDFLPYSSPSRSNYIATAPLFARSARAGETGGGSKGLDGCIWEGEKMRRKLSVTRALDFKGRTGKLPDIKSRELLCWDQSRTSNSG